MRASRLLAIMVMLQGRGRVTAQTLADRFEVSRRTIYRDLDQLSAAGVPVLADRGVGGGIALAAGFRSDFTALTPEEAAAFPLCGLPDLASRLGIAAAAAGARAKIIAALGANAALLATRFHLDPADWYDRVATPPHLAVAARAVLAQRRLRISYESWSKRREHTLDPLGLVVKSGDWYLLGRARQRIGIYRVAGIVAAALTDDGFRSPAEFDLALAWRRHVAGFEARMFAGSAEIRVAAEMLPRLARLGAPAAAAVMRSQPAADGSRRAMVPIEGIDAFARELLPFGAAVEVIAPAELHERVASLVGALARHYGISR